jgi:MFS family permease
LESDETPLGVPLTVDETSWIASLAMFGDMASSPFYASSADKFGRKWTLMLTVVPQILLWTIIDFSGTWLHLCIARFLVGFGGTSFYLLVPMYVTEIASVQMRNRLGSIMVFSTTFRLVVGFAINSYLDFRTVPCIVISILVIFILGFLFVAEALAALKFFRGYSKSD